jgi:ABC-type uncharacterized transport system substrate-binding protein
VLASELVNLPVDLIVAWGTPASLAAHKATATIPIVMSAGDPVGAGIVTGLAHPGAAGPPLEDRCSRKRVLVLRHAREPSAATLPSRRQGR